MAGKGSAQGFFQRPRMKTAAWFFPAVAVLGWARLALVRGEPWPAAADAGLFFCILLILVHTCEIDFSPGLASLSLSVPVQMAIVISFPLPASLGVLVVGTFFGILVAHPQDSIMPRPVFAFNNTGIALLSAWLVTHFFPRLPGILPFAPQSESWVYYGVRFAGAYLVFLAPSALLLLVKHFLHGRLVRPAALVNVAIPLAVEAALMPIGFLVVVAYSRFRQAGLLTVAVPLIAASFALTNLEQSRKRLLERVGQLSELHHLLERMARLNSPEGLFALLKNSVQQLLGPQKLCLSLLAADGRELDYVLEADQDGEAVTRKVPLPAGLEGAVLRRGATVAVDDWQELADRPLVTFAEGQTPPRCYVGLPLNSEHRALGIISVASDRPNAFSAHDQEVLGILANHTAEALANWSLVQQMDRDLEDTVQALVRIVEDQDKSTIGHSRRVARYSELVCRRLGLDEETMKNVRLGALLHDVGKVVVPSRVYKAGRALTPEERELIRRNPQRSAEIIEEMPLLKDVRCIVEQHRERLDGSGDPDGLRGEQICLGARIVGAAEMLDAMTNPRPYRPAKLPEEALREIERLAGTQLDPAVVRALAEIVRSESGPAAEEGS